MLLSGHIYGLTCEILGALSKTPCKSHYKKKLQNILLRVTFVANCGYPTGFRRGDVVSARRATLATSQQHRPLPPQQLSYSSTKQNRELMRSRKVSSFFFAKRNLRFLEEMVVKTSGNSFGGFRRVNFLREKEGRNH